MKRSILISMLLFAALPVFGGVFAATDKSAYVAGERVLFSVFSNDGDAVCYVELHNGSSCQLKAKIALDNGRGGGVMELPLTLPTDNYRIVTYTASGSSDQALISVYNCFSTDRGNNVKVTSSASEPVLQRVPDSEVGLSLENRDGMLYVRNEGKTAVSAYVSIYKADALPCYEPHFITLYSSGKAVADAVEPDGEVIFARLCGEDADKVSKEETATLALSFPGLKTDIYTSRVRSDAIMEIPTENIYGKRDVACMLYGLQEGDVCHIELMDKSFRGQIRPVPSLKLDRKYADCLLDRAVTLQRECETADTLFNSLPYRRDHFFLDDECASYILDDYTRFPTIDEEIVEIIKSVRVRKVEDRHKIQVFYTDDRVNSLYTWGNSLMMIDGVPVFDHEKIWTYDPSLVKRVDVYQRSYSLGFRTYGGVINFVTYKGNLPGISFDDNVRIYDFIGCSYPVIHRGASTLYFNPMVTVGPGESFAVDCGSAAAGAVYNVVAGGVNAAGTTVYASRVFEGL